LQYHARS